MGNKPPLRSRSGKARLILEIDPHFPQPGIIEHALEKINDSSGVFIYPTDTIYGLGCAINNKEGIEIIKNIKTRDNSKSFVVLCKDLKQVKSLTEVSRSQEKILKKYWPGPFTFILRANKNCPIDIQAIDGTVAIRIPRNKFCLEFIKAIKQPIISTSVNHSGETPVNDLEHIPEDILKNVDLILDANLIEALPSTIVDLTKTPPVITRQGRGIYENNSTT